MRVVPRRSKGRQGAPGAEPVRPDEPTVPSPSSPVQVRAPVTVEEPLPPTQPLGPSDLPGASDLPGGSGPVGRRAAKKAARAEAKAVKRGRRKAGRRKGGDAAAPAPPVEPPAMPDPDQRRRARSAERHRAAAEAKRSRAAQRQGLARKGGTPEAKALRQHRSALLVMVITLGLLIAAVAVTGGMIAGQMRTRPVALAAPLHVYPVTQTAPGQCPNGTQGVSAQAVGGMTCYQMTQGIAIREVADLRVQKSRTAGSDYEVAVTLRKADRRAFAALTRATVGHDLAFVVRNTIVTLPRVDMPILDGKVVVTGQPSRKDAARLIRALKGG
ncbi:SecDF P1 head subdomain-containing protein [Actinomadura xylanilytica]|uniref:SecDF P1 head subdomain-containing protein n=1 Tax=Actinomadura xylanilytica TaxID=887459 RepID=UPI00255AE7BA|nr:hypothetical protein [Actinomadura xylanilytica]MDL4777622.1 hypothetical protein [Actinomadura xylanilytica]